MRILLVLLFLVGCTQRPGLTPVESASCDFKDNLSTGVSVALTSLLNCTKSDVIKQDVRKVFGNVELCSAVPKASKKFKGPLANLACPLAVSSVVGFLSNQIPSTWECSPKDAVAVQALSGIVVTACEAAIPL